MIIIKEINLPDYNIYTNKDGRMRAYNKKTHAVTSYPRVVMEQILGRPLEKDEDVHHKDENPLNNDPDNLEVISHSEHERFHALYSESFLKHRKYFDKEMTCPECGRSFIWTACQQRNVHHNRIGQAGPFCSNHCARVYSRRIQLKNK